MPFTKEFIKRFWRKVKKTHRCWIWMAAHSQKGYGSVGVPTRKIGRRVRFVTQAAHRISWEISKGKIPQGLQVCHKCDNPPCVRPDHLFLGTNMDNVQDMVMKGRHVAGGQEGEDHHHAIFTDAQVVALRARVRAGMTIAQLAYELDVAPQTLRRAIAGINYSHLPGVIAAPSKNKLVTAFGRTLTTKQWEKETGVPCGLIRHRLRRRWPPEEAVSPRTTDRRFKRQ